jgi:hypothetical protein
MRLAPLLALTVAIVAVAPIAMAGDRYGPPPVRRPAPAPGLTPGTPTPISYSGPTLGWAGKVSAVPPAASTPQAPAAPQRLANGLYGSRAAAAPASVAPVAPTAPLPESLYAPASPATPPPPTAVLPPPPGPTRMAASPYAGSAPRAYSVIREYGGTPDPIAAPTGAGSAAFRPETSLVTPLDDPKPKKARTADAPNSEGGDPDWGAADDPGLSEGNP